MKYTYYPGCSLKSSGKHYDESIRAVFSALGLPLEELQDWNCCGATAYMSIDEHNAHALAARNLALAESASTNGAVQLITPCNACFLVLLKAQKAVCADDAMGETLRDALKEIGLNYRGTVQVRHPLDILINDVGEEKIRKAVKRPLSGFTIASYYGCQIVRPYAPFDDQYNPMTMDKLFSWAGAKTVDWCMKARCCGGTLTGTIPEAGQRLSFIILKEAQRRGAQIIGTACPLCQFNLECYQTEMRKAFADPIDLPVAYFSQLLGVALGLGKKELGLQRLLVPLPFASSLAA